MPHETTDQTTAATTPAVPSPDRVDALMGEVRRRLAGRPLTAWHHAAPPDALRGDVLAAVLADAVDRLRAAVASRDANIQRMEREYQTGQRAWERQVEALYDAKHAAERECERYRRAVADLATRGYGVRRPKWLLATIARATPTPAAPGARGA